MPTAAVDSPTVVDVRISGPGFNDAERFELADDRGARAFARDVMNFALHPEQRKRRVRTSGPIAGEGRE
jgi:hypothetical protein